MPLPLLPQPLPPPPLPLPALQVREAGGLMVAITSLQPGQRSELQLRGRAGR